MNHAKRPMPSKFSLVCRAFFVAALAGLISVAIPTGLASTNVLQEKGTKTAPFATSGSGTKYNTRQRGARTPGKRAKASTMLEASKRAALAACVETSITVPATNINGVLESGDCVLQQDGTLYDIYKFSGTAGQQISISLSSAQFDAYLFLVDFDGQNALVLGEDDDGAGGTNSRIPSTSGFATLPYTGDYFILANTFSAGETGTYTLNVATTAGFCNPTPTTIGAGTTNGSLGSPDCRFVDDTFYDIYAFSGTAGQQISIQQTAGFDAVVYILDSQRNILGADDDDGGGTNARIPAVSGFITLPYTGTYHIVANSIARTLSPPTPTPTGPYSLIIGISGTPCPTTPITIGQTISNGQLVPASDCKLPDETLVDIYTLDATSGQQVAISMDSTQFDTFLFLTDTANQLFQLNDDATGTNSRIPVSGFLTLPATGTYRILANTFAPGEQGAYTLSVTGPAPPATSLEFSAASFPVNEGDQFVNVTVTRSGNTTIASTVDYGTSNSSATERKDYTAQYGRLRFAAGETTKSFPVLVVDDRFDDDGESFNIALSSPVNASLGAQSIANIPITDNDASTTTSPLRDASIEPAFFVRLHYADFLGRTPDTAGLNFWVDKATNCGEADLLVCRINVSAAFFLSIEYRDTGYLAHRTHKIAFGNLPGKPVPITLRDFLFDARRLGEGVVVGVGDWEAKFEANKVAYFNEFVERQQFDSMYGLLSNAQYVEALRANSNDGLSQAEGETLVAALNGSTMTRAQVLRAVAEDADFSNGIEKNRAFVLSQYFGYLRRNPDEAGFNGQTDPTFEGYNFWLAKLNQFNGNFISAEMVKAFIQSIEYVERVGS